MTVLVGQPQRRLRDQQSLEWPLGPRQAKAELSPWHLLLHPVIHPGSCQAAHEWGWRAGLECKRPTPAFPRVTEHRRAHELRDPTDPEGPSSRGRCPLRDRGAELWLGPGGAAPGCWLDWAWWESQALSWRATGDRAPRAALPGKDAGARLHGSCQTWENLELSGRRGGRSQEG